MFSGLLGKPCCRKRIGRDRSLRIGFGLKVPHNKLGHLDDYYGEWEIGTYTASWRIYKGRNIFCGSKEPVDSNRELDEILQKVTFDSIVSIKDISPFDIQVKFNNEVCIDIMSSSSDDDEVFHVFGPLGKYIEYTVEQGWKVGRSDEPWS